MKVYIYKYVDRITTSYHDGGGLVIITDRNPLDVLNEEIGGVKDYDRKPLRRTELPQPDHVIETMSNEERIYIFPDAGCC